MCVSRSILQQYISVVLARRNVYYCAHEYRRGMNNVLFINFVLTLQGLWHAPPRHSIQNCLTHFKASLRPPPSVTSYGVCDMRLAELLKQCCSKAVLCNTQPGSEIHTNDRSQYVLIEGSLTQTLIESQGDSTSSTPVIHLTYLAVACHSV